MQFNFLLAHREDPFCVCSFGVLWNEKYWMVIKHSLNEAHSGTDEYPPEPLGTFAHRTNPGTAVSIPYLGGAQKWSCRTEVWCVREDHSVLNGT